MVLETLTIKSEGVKPMNYHVHLTQTELRERNQEKRNCTLAMAFSNVFSKTVIKGKVEALSSLDGKQLETRRPAGRFSSTNEETYEAGVGSGTQTLTLKDRNTLIEVTEYNNDLCDHGSYGVMKTRNHWYQPWKQVALTNPEICWDLK
jgi:hypothetical protein